METTKKEELKERWSNIPGVTFSPLSNATTKRRKRVKVVIRKREITVPEAAQMIGISRDSFCNTLIAHRYLPYTTKKVIRGKVRWHYDQIYVMERKDVEELWARLCAVKGIKKGTKLGSLSCLQRLPKPEKVRIMIEANE